MWMFFMNLWIFYNLLVVVIVVAAAVVVTEVVVAVVAVVVVVPELFIEIIFESEFVKKSSKIYVVITW